MAQGSFSAQLQQQSPERTTRTQRVIVKQETEKRRFQSERQAVAFEKANTELSKATTQSEYEQTYKTLSPEQQQYFLTPSELKATQLANQEKSRLEELSKTKTALEYAEKERERIESNYNQETNSTARQSLKKEVQMQNEYVVGLRYGYDRLNRGESLTFSDIETYASKSARQKGERYDEREKAKLNPVVDKLGDFTGYIVKEDVKAQKIEGVKLYSKGEIVGTATPKQYDTALKQAERISNIEFNAVVSPEQQAYKERVEAIKVTPTQVEKKKTSVLNQLAYIHLRTLQKEGQFVMDAFTSSVPIMEGYGYLEGNKPTTATQEQIARERLAIKQKLTFKNMFVTGQTFEFAGHKYYEPPFIAPLLPAQLQAFQSKQALRKKEEEAKTEILKLGVQQEAYAKVSPQFEEVNTAQEKLNTDIKIATEQETITPEKFEEFTVRQNAINDKSVSIISSLADKGLKPTFEVTSEGEQLKFTSPQSTADLQTVTQKELRGMTKQQRYNAYIGKAGENFIEYTMLGATLQGIGLTGAVGRGLSYKVPIFNTAKTISPALKTAGRIGSGIFTGGLVGVGIGAKGLQSGKSFSEAGLPYIEGFVVGSGETTSKIAGFYTGTILSSQAQISKEIKDASEGKYEDTIGMRKGRYYEEGNKIKAKDIIQAEKGETKIGDTQFKTEKYLKEITGEGNKFTQVTKYNVGNKLKKEIVSGYVSEPNQVNNKVLREFIAIKKINGGREISLYQQTAVVDKYTPTRVLSDKEMGILLSRAGTYQVGQPVVVQGKFSLTKVGDAINKIRAFKTVSEPMATSNLQFLETQKVPASQGDIFQFGNKYVITDTGKVTIFKSVGLGRSESLELNKYATVKSLLNTQIKNLLYGQGIGKSGQASLEPLSLERLRASLIPAKPLPSPVLTSIPPSSFNTELVNIPMPNVSLIKAINSAEASIRGIAFGQALVGGTAILGGFATVSIPLTTQFSQETQLQRLINRQSFAVSTKQATPTAQVPRQSQSQQSQQVQRIIQEIITPTVTPLTPPPYKPPTTSFPKFFLPDSNAKLKAKLRKKRRKTPEIVGLFPDFTSKAFGFAPKQMSVKQAIKEMNKLQTGFGLRTGVSIRGYKPVDEKSLMIGIMK